MTTPRISVQSVMAAMIVIALDCVMVRAVESRPGLTTTLQLVIWGALPMANLLAVGLALLLRESGGRRPFLRGFVAFGAIALGAFVGCALLWRGWIVERLETILTPLVGAMDSDISPAWMAIVQLGVLPAFLLLPQLLVALVGGVLTRQCLGRCDPGPVADPTPRRPGLRPILAPLILVAVPALAIEGYLRWKIDPESARLHAGSVAVLDLDSLSAFRTILPGGSAASLTDGARVRVDYDDGPDQLGVVRTPRGEQTSNVRLVRVTLLDGPRHGESTWMLRCALRPARQAGPF
jgi:hypothetical protein